MMRKYIKSKLLFFLILTGISFCFFKLLGTTEARDNAYLASFIDEDSCMYKFQVIYSGSEVELARISAFLNEDSMLTQNGRISILGNFVQNSVKTDNNSMVTPKDGAPGTAEVADYELAVSVNSDPDRDKTGHFNFKIYDKLGNQSYDVKSFDFTKFDKEFEKTKAKPMTFPFDSTYNASTSDINRAYKVMDTICNDFTEALLFINSGKSYTSVDSLIEAAYYLVTAGSDSYGGSAVIQNEYGNKFMINYNSSQKTSNGGLNNQVTITEVSSKSSDNRSRTFTWRCKKGYKGYEKGDQLEDGESNTLTISDSANEHDTEYITWEHLFIEAGLLYAEGISYSNAADLFTTDALESSFVSFTRNVLGQLRGLLQLYEMEDCVFNSGVRGSRAFVYGAYLNNWTSGISSMFFIFVAVALAIVVIPVINLFVKKQFATISATARFSLLEGIRDLIVAVIGITFAWVILKLLLLLNYEFVDIWREFVGTKKMSDSGGGYATFGAILYQFIYFFISIYVNIVYILRQFFIPALMIISPICILAFGFGPKGKMVCGNWMKQLVGVIFIQSFHALVYGFIVANSVGLRGIESLLTCASFIPLTTIISNTFGISPSDMLRQAASTTNTTRAGLSGAVALGTGAVSGTLSGAANIVDRVSASKSSAASGKSFFSPSSTVTGSILRGLSGATRVSGGATSSMIGAGHDLALQDQSGTADIQRGASNMGAGISDMATGLGSAGASVYMSRYAKSHPYGNGPSASGSNRSAVGRNSNSYRNGSYNTRTNNNGNEQNGSEHVSSFTTGATMNTENTTETSSTQTGASFDPNRVAGSQREISSSDGTSNTENTKDSSNKTNGFQRIADLRSTSEASSYFGRNLTKADTSYLGSSNKAVRSYNVKIPRESHGTEDTRAMELYNRAINMNALQQSGKKKEYNAERQKLVQEYGIKGMEIKTKNEYKDGNLVKSSPYLRIHTVQFPKDKQ